MILYSLIDKIIEGYQKGSIDRTSAMEHINASNTDSGQLKSPLISFNKYLDDNDVPAERLASIRTLAGALKETDILGGGDAIDLDTVLALAEKWSNCFEHSSNVDVAHKKRLEFDFTGFIPPSRLRKDGSFNFYPAYEVSRLGNYFGYDVSNELQHTIAEALTDIVDGKTSTPALLETEVIKMGGVIFGAQRDLSSSVEDIEVLVYFPTVGEVVMDKLMRKEKDSSSTTTSGKISMIASVPPWDYYDE